MARASLWIGVAILELLIAALIVFRPGLKPLVYTHLPLVPRVASVTSAQSLPADKPGGDVSKKTETFKMILDRVNHLEGILSSSLLSLLISTTLAVGGGAYTIKDKRIPISGFTVFFGANLVYVLLSAQYYFMLTHFYSAMIFMINQNQSAQVADLQLLWIEFQSPMPLIGSKVPQFIYLIQATLAPLLFAIMTIVGLWAVFLKKEVSAVQAGWSDKHQVQLKADDGSSTATVAIQEAIVAIDGQPPLSFAAVFAAISLHVLVWASMIWSPFWDFFRALDGYVRL
jgi:hypothetical protein